MPDRRPSGGLRHSLSRQTSCCPGPGQAGRRARCPHPACPRPRALLARALRPPGPGPRFSSKLGGGLLATGSPLPPSPVSALPRAADEPEHPEGLTWSEEGTGGWGRGRVPNMCLAAAGPCHTRLPRLPHRAALCRAWKLPCGQPRRTERLGWRRGHRAPPPAPAPGASFSAPGTQPRSCLIALNSPAACGTDKPVSAPEVASPDFAGERVWSRVSVPPQTVVLPLQVTAGKSVCQFSVPHIF